MSPRRLILAAGAVVAGCASIFALQVPVRVDGGVLVDTNGLTLYTFDRDPRGASACSGKCAASWPPLIAGPDASAAGDYTLVVRKDGRRQWAYKGKPLYRWTGDQAPGERTGDGYDNLWRAARP